MGVQRTQVLTAMRHRHSEDRACDAVVVGAGPAGLIAARTLAERGFAVTVLEEHDVIGAPVHCTGVLGVEAFDELRLPRRAIVTISHSARFVGPTGSSIVIEAERVRAAVVDRGTFDRDLAAAAMAAGATIRTAARVATVHQLPDAVVVQSSVGEIRARAAVLACGASYRFNRALGLGIPGVLVHSAQLDIPFPRLDDIQVHFGRSVAPGGFAWIVPFERSGSTFARVGLFCDRDAGSHFKTFAETIRAAHGVADPWPTARLKVLPLAPITRTWTDRILAVGDAAGVVKPTTGGGIYYGVLTGQIAAEVLGDALHEDRLHARRLREYERRWRARLGPEIRAGLAFRAVASRLSDTAIERLMELARVDGIVPLLKQTADFNWHRTAAQALLRHSEFRKIVLSSMWS
jgi:digeranylgeranylglycerophospholipid reductase